MAWRFFFNHKAGIEAESLKEKLYEWTTLSDKYQYLLLEQDLYNSLQNAGLLSGDNLKMLSAQPVAMGKFSIHVKCASVKEAQEIKKMKQTNHNSLGTQIASSRLNLVNSLYGTSLKTVYTDLKNEKGEPVGTRVEIHIPIMT